MTAVHQRKGFEWVRFSDYVFVDGPYGGGAIAPAPNAEVIEYGPWQKYREAARGYAKQPHDREENAGEPAYLSLWRLGQRFDGDKWFEGEPDYVAEQQAAILRFVRGHGLLGLFHHSMLQVARSRKSRVWMRIGADWHLNSIAKEAVTLHCLQMPAIGTPHIDAFPFAEVSKQYFDRDMPRDLPHPRSPEFFIHYRETTEQFLLEAHSFWLAVEQLRQGDGSAIDLLRADMSWRLRPSEGKAVRGEAAYEEEPVYPSLLAALADMAARDLALGGFRLTACTECGAILRTNFHRTAYCSEQCRWKAAQRSRRQRLDRATETKESQGDHRKGGSR